MIGFPKKIMMIILLLMLSSYVYAEKPSTNEEFVTTTISSEFKSLLDSLDIKSGGIQFESQAGLTSLIVDGAKSGAINAGLKLIGSDRINNDNDYKVTISLSAFEFKYTNGKSRGFLKHDNVKRNLAGQILVNISRNDFNYLGFREFVNTDEVEPDAVNYISSIRYNQLSQKSPGSGVKKYIEPLAVTATVGGLIYLFFINR